MDCTYIHTHTLKHSQTHARVYTIVHNAHTISQAGEHQSPGGDLSAIDGPPSPEKFQANTLTLSIAHEPGPDNHSEGNASSRPMTARTPIQNQNVRSVCAIRDDLITILSKGILRPLVSGVVNTPLRYAQARMFVCGARADMPLEKLLLNRVLLPALRSFMLGRRYVYTHAYIPYIHLQCGPQLLSITLVYVTCRQLH
jgi:hypothetical protein